MNFPCLTQINFLETPQFLTLGFYIITAIATPIHIFGLWCILFKTTEQMKNAKWYLVNLHVSIVLFDYSYGLLTCPFVLLPKLAGYPLGVLRHFGIETQDQTLLVMLMFCCVINSIVAIFENRFNTMVKNNTWKSLRRPWLAAHYITAVLILTPFRFMVPEQEIARKHVLQSLPTLPCYVYEASVFVFTDSYTYIMVVGATYTLFLTFEILLFSGFLVFKAIRQLKINSISTKTFHMQRRFFMALVIQMKTPFVTLSLPLIYSWIAIESNYYNQKMTNFGVLLGGLHGSVSTLVMLFVHHPYRMAVFDLIGCKVRSFNRISERRSDYIKRNNIGV